MIIKILNEAHVQKSVYPFLNIFDSKLVEKYKIVYGNSSHNKVQPSQKDHPGFGLQRILGCHNAVQPHPLPFFQLRLAMLAGSSALLRFIVNEFYTYAAELVDWTRCHGPARETGPKAVP